MTDIGHMRLGYQSPAQRFEAVLRRPVEVTVNFALSEHWCALSKFLDCGRSDSALTRLRTVLRLERLVAQPVERLRQQRHDVPAGECQGLRERDHGAVACQGARYHFRGGLALH